MTHIDKVLAFGQRVADNLNTMGVDAELNDGALTLADKILDIGSDDSLTTDLTLSSSQPTYFEYDTIQIDAILHAQKSGTLNFNGLIEGATISIKENNTIVQNSITDENGIVSLIIPEAQTGLYTYVANFEQYGGYPSAMSNILILQVKQNYLATVYRNRTSFYYNGANPNLTSFENGILTATSNSGSVILTPFTDETDWEIEFDLWIENAENGFFYLGSSPCFSIGRNANSQIEFQRNIKGTKTVLGSFDNCFENNWQHWNIKYDDGYFTVTIDDNEMICETQVNDVLPYIGLRKYTKGHMRIKDFEVIEET